MVKSSLPNSLIQGLLRIVFEASGLAARNMNLARALYPQCCRIVTRAFFNFPVLPNSAGVRWRNTMGNADCLYRSSLTSRRREIPFGL